VQQKVYLAFQGGGAKGIVHIGGLRAVEEKTDLKIAGVAGTSAGAMVATLVACGYRGRDLMNHDKRSHLLQTLANREFKDATDFFPRSGWLAIRALRWVSHVSTSLPRLAPVDWFGLAIAVMLVLVVTLPLLHASVGTMYDLSLTAFGLLCGIAITTAVGSTRGYLSFIPLWYALTVCAIIFCIFDAGHPIAGVIFSVVLMCFAVSVLTLLLVGITTVGKVRDFIDEIIGARLGIKNRDITFADLHRVKALPLKIVATNITDERLELFCLERTPHVPVADAVAASICLPVIFRPWSFRVNLSRNVDAPKVRTRFVDGGLMSNLPAWAFDEERLVDPQSLTIAFGIKPSGSKAPFTRRHWLAAAVNSVVSGAKEVHLRATGRSLEIPISCELDTLAFDAKLDKFYEQVEKSYQEVGGHLKREITEYPAMFRKACGVLQSAVSATLPLHRGRAFASGVQQTDRIRVAFAIQRPGSLQSVQLGYSAGYLASDPDFAITLPLDGSLVGSAWSLNETEAKVLGKLEQPKLARSHLIWPEIKWTICIPITRRPRATGGNDFRRLVPNERVFVVVVDGNIPILDRAWGVEAAFASFARGVEKKVLGYIKSAGIDAAAQVSSSWL
jgi:NTE family protein